MSSEHWSFRQAKAFRLLAPQKERSNTKTYGFISFQKLLKKGITEV